MKGSLKKHDKSGWPKIIWDTRVYWGYFVWKSTVGNFSSETFRVHESFSTLWKPLRTAKEPALVLIFFWKNIQLRTVFFEIPCRFWTASSCAVNFLFHLLQTFVIHSTILIHSSFTLQQYCHFLSDPEGLFLKLRR